MHAVGHHTVGVLGDDDAAVYQHAQSQQHAEHHHEIEGIAQLVDNNHREQQGHRNTQADDNTTPEAHGRHHQYHDQRQRGDNIALQFAHLKRGEFSLVLRYDHLDARRNTRSRRVHQRQYLLYTVYDIGVGALGDLDRYGLATVVARVTGAILESPSHRGHILQRHYRVTGTADRQVEDIRGLFNHGGHFHRKAPFAGINTAGRDQAIIALQRVQQLLAGDAVGIECVRVDDNLEHLLALSLKRGGQHRGDGFYIVPQCQGGLVDAAFAGVLAYEIDLDNRKIVDREFAHKGLLGSARNFSLGTIHRLAHIAQRLVEILGDIKLNKKCRHAFRRCGLELQHALELAQFDFHRLNQQALGILGGDTLVGDTDIEKRHLDMRVVGNGQCGARGQPGHHDRSQ